jgi:hypothetical protein
MNAYYQANGRNDNACDFKGTGMVTSSDPSKFTTIELFLNSTLDCS